jgi:hypothetical protein
MLKEEGLKAYRPTIASEINNINKQKRIEFRNVVRRWTLNWQKVIFSDENWLCAEAFHLLYVRCFAGEVLSEKYSVKKTRFKSDKKVLVWAVISYTEPGCLYFIEGKDNTDVYEQILEECLPDIKEI